MRFSLTLAALFLTTSALAQTPDGETPSEETYCDDYSGAAFGICNAYCEAQDCDDPANTSNGRSCERLEDRWERLDEGAFPTCGSAPPNPEECLEECTLDYKGDLSQCETKREAPVTEERARVAYLDESPMLEGPILDECPQKQDCDGPGLTCADEAREELAACQSECLPVSDCQHRGQIGDDCPTESE